MAISPLIALWFLATGAVTLVARVRRLWPVARLVAVAVLAVGGVALAAWVVWVLGPGAAWWLEHVDGVKVGGKEGLKGKDLADALDVVRGRAMALGTGLLAAVAIFYTASNAASARRLADAAQQTSQLTEQGQVTGRYTAAIEQLGSDKLDIRVGGIYALERIARDSARDHPTVMAVLATFVREHSHDSDAHSGTGTSTGAEGAGPGEQPRERHRFRPDLQAAVTVIGRRTTGHDTDFIDLNGANLNGANLNDANLLGADLRGADLSGAYLTRVNLFDAYLPGAQLPGANLNDANLRRANLRRANLNDADLNDADLNDADLNDADLNGADLRGVVWSERTVWPESASGADGIRAWSEPVEGSWRAEVFRVRNS